MAEGWLLTFKPTFLNESLTLPPKELAQVQKKLALLAQDPTPDAKVKKQLKYWDGKLHRLRSGDFRIFYTFQQPYVSVLALRRRDDDTYDEDLDGEFLGGLEPSAVPSNNAPEPQGWQRWLTPSKAAPASTPLPRPIDAALLDSLRIPKQFHAVLLALKTEDDLLDATSVPDDVRTRVCDALYERPLHQVAQQPDLLLPSAEDLLRYREGELLGFLLKLDQEQEKFVTWGAKAAGPTLIKGGPGTGKSTIALYRTRVMIDALRKKGIASPTLLFTTYTRALTRVSEQLLASLLGDDAKLVDVRTADSVCLDVAKTEGATFHFATRPELLKTLVQAIQATKLEGNSLQIAAQKKTLEGMGLSYLLDEILGVIEARGLQTEQEYQSADRPGRVRPLNRTQRGAVWRVRNTLNAQLAAMHLDTWEQVRTRASDLVATGTVQPSYDGVLIDEAQDLQPSALRVLVGLSRNANQILLTADANQSIYGGGFRWVDVHERLKFQGRTGILRANHRSTKEIDEAAHEFLAAGQLDVDTMGERVHVHSGPVPAVRAVATVRDEVELLARFCQGATRDFRLGYGSCAVLCPFNQSAERIAKALVAAGVPATYTTADNLDLLARGVKVLTLKNAKGLEFPIVALAGFLDSRYPVFPKDATAEERTEISAQERRTLFVGMTRAMRALLVVVPSGDETSLLNGFSEARWNLGGEA